MLQSVQLVEFPKQLFMQDMLQGLHFVAPFEIER